MNIYPNLVVVYGYYTKVTFDSREIWFVAIGLILDSNSETFIAASKQLTEDFVLKILRNILYSP